MQKKAAIYCRSSKDRSDVSIDAQRRELKKLAAEMGIMIIKEYTDVVESAKDEHRPGFQSLLADLKSHRRDWNHLMMVDTSRLSRRRYMAQVFKHEAKKRNVKIIYSKLPESDPIADMVIIGVMEVFDELHSLMSREKGLAGMAENVNQGFRAGGRAPRGYRLTPVATGAIRDGENVTKSKLEPTEEADQIKQYLQQRAAGAPRKRAIEKTGLTIASTSLIGMEWNALTYAGHTVWNCRNEYQVGHGYKGNSKYRPRSEWVIKMDTHEALITTQEAESILTQLSTSASSKARRTPAKYLLTGLLKTPDGHSWFGNNKTHYRTKTGKGRYIKKDEIERAIIDKVSSDMRSKQFVKKLASISRRTRKIEDPTIKLRAQANKINTQISKTMDLAGKLASPAPAVRKIDELEKKRAVLMDEIDRRQKEYAGLMATANITEGDIQKKLKTIAGDMDKMEPEHLKDALNEYVSQVLLDPETLDCQVFYRIEYRNNMASPRGVEPLSPP